MLVLFFVILASVALVAPARADGLKLGRYIGDLVVKAQSDGRSLELASDFAYEDADKLVWHVPKGTIVNGASIPSPLWSIIGGPFSGKYRDASVIHDHACVVKERDWKRVHRTFYEAMLTSGVAKWKARQMYLAVYVFGPKWGGNGPITSGRTSLLAFLPRNTQMSMHSINDEIGRIVKGEEYSFRSQRSRQPFQQQPNDRSQLRRRMSKSEQRRLLALVALRQIRRHHQKEDLPTSDIQFLLDTDRMFRRYCRLC